MADIQSLKQALSVSPDNLPIVLMLGQAYLEEFHFEEARAAFEKALQLEAGIRLPELSSLRFLSWKENHRRRSCGLSSSSVNIPGMPLR